MATKKTEKSTGKQNFKALYKELLKKIEQNDVLSKDALLKQQMQDFERMAEMNDNLWQEIQSRGYMYEDIKTGRMIVNPAVSTFNKNASTCLKTVQWIEEKTKAISINDSKKSW